jgi:hypothetical protein
MTGARVALVSVSILSKTRQRHRHNRVFFAERPATAGGTSVVAVRVQVGIHTVRLQDPGSDSTAR